MAISVDISDDRRVMIVKLTGRLTYDDWPEFRDKCLHTAGLSELLLDVRHLKEINVAGFSMLLLLRRRLFRQDRRVTLLTCNTDVARFLHWLEFEQWFQLPRGCTEGRQVDDCSTLCNRMIRDFRDRYRVC